MTKKTQTKKAPVKKTPTKKPFKPKQKTLLSIAVVNEGSSSLPVHKTEEAAGADVYANTSYPITIAPGERKLISTGLKVKIPKGYCLQVYSRSGLALKKGLTVLNSPGLIDSDYSGEIGVILVNHSDKKVMIGKGDRIAQFVLQKYEPITWEVVSQEKLDELHGESDREGGFGSTGEK